VAGAFPAECLSLLEGLGDRVRFVRGNGDRDVTSDPPGGQFPGRSAWCAARLDAEAVARVRAWPLTIEVELPSLGRVLFCHAVPGDDMPILTTLTTDDEVAAAIGPVDAEIVVCGHVHVQYDRTLPGGPRVVNAGAVGAPYEGRAAAFWLLLGEDVEHVSTDYDVEAAIARLEATGCPDTDWVVQHALRAPVVAADAMAQFEQMRTGATSEA
jgi:diadenosine tetraphosphatase ApaH/serine/threonine PP2A family protein phosphatase